MLVSASATNRSIPVGQALELERRQAQALADTPGEPFGEFLHATQFGGIAAHKEHKQTDGIVKAALPSLNNRP